MDVVTKSSTPASDQVPAFRAVALDLLALDVDTVFGLMGEDTAKLVTALQDVGITYHGARHENTAVAMADGYARATDRLGVCAISRGPGFTNGLTAAANAAKAGSPVLIILGTSPAHADPNRIGPDYKDFDNVGVGVVAGLTVFSPRSASTVRTALQDAAAAALRGRTVALMIPVDLIDHPVRMEGQPGDPAQLTPAARPMPAEPVALAAAVEALKASERPVIVAGYGAHRSGARDVLIQLAERSGALLGTSLRAKDMFRGHRYDLGIVGTYSHRVTRDLVSQADLALAFGAGLAQHTIDSGEMFQQARTVQVDTIRSHIGRHSRTDIGVVGDARVVAEQMVEEFGDGAVDKPFHAESTLRRLAEVDRAKEFESQTTHWTIDPRSLVIELADVLPADRVVAHDIGNFMSFVAPNLPVQSPSHYHYPMDFSAIGLGLGIALGIAAGKPYTPTVLFVGDGALLMTLGELETVVRCDLPMVIVVMNDAAYGAEAHFLEMEGMSATSARYPDVDFADVAVSFGMEASTVRSIGDVRALGPVLSDLKGAILLDCKVTPMNRA
jgi:acetolactate synthase-1/2/3 large subunit